MYPANSVEQFKLRIEARSDVRVLIEKRSQYLRTRREVVTNAQPAGFRVLGLAQTRIETVRVEEETEITLVALGRAQFCQQAGVVGDRELEKRAVDVLVRIVVVAKSVRLEMILAEAEREAVPDSGDRRIVTPGIVATDDRGCLDAQLIRGRTVE